MLDSVSRHESVKLTTQSRQWEEVTSCLGRFHVGSAMEKGRYRVHYHRVRELPEEFLRIGPAMSVMEKAGYGKTEESSPVSIIPFAPWLTFALISPPFSSMLEAHRPGAS